VSREGVEVDFGLDRVDDEWGGEVVCHGCTDNRQELTSLPSPTTVAQTVGTRYHLSSAF
jgi:hypothetical protein